MSDERPTVQRIDRSPMNPKVRIALLSCGHDHYLYPGKRLKIGATHDCEKCRNKREPK